MKLGTRPRARGEARRAAAAAELRDAVHAHHGEPDRRRRVAARSGRDVLREAAAGAVGEARLRVGGGRRAAAARDAVPGWPRARALARAVGRRSWSAEGFTRRARIPLTGRAGTTLATVRFDKPAARALGAAAVVGRGAGGRPAGAASRAEGRRRRERRRSTRSSSASSSCTTARAATSSSIRLIGPDGPVPLPVLYVDALAYVSKEALTAWLLGQVRCETRRHARLGHARLAAEPRLRGGGHVPARPSGTTASARRPCRCGRRRSSGRRAGPG